MPPAADTRPVIHYSFIIDETTEDSNTVRLDDEGRIRHADSPPKVIAISFQSQPALRLNMDTMRELIERSGLGSEITVEWNEGYLGMNMRFTDPENEAGLYETAFKVIFNPHEWILRHHK